MAYNLYSLHIGLQMAGYKLAEIEGRVIPLVEQDIFISCIVSLYFLLF